MRSAGSVDALVRGGGGGLSRISSGAGSSLQSDSRRDVLAGLGDCSERDYDERAGLVQFECS